MTLINNDFFRIVTSSDTVSSDHDVLILVGDSYETTDSFPEFVHPSLTLVKDHKECDSATDEICCLVQNGGGKKILVVWSPTGPLNRDYDDVRRYKEAALKGIERAVQSNKRSPVLVVSSSHTQHTEYKDSLLVAVLGAMQAAYVPIEVREQVPDKKSKLDVLGIASTELSSAGDGERFLNTVAGVELGRIIARDIGGSDPERMSAPNVETYLKEVFAGTSIVMEVVQGHEAFVKDYPLFAAVDRCSNVVPEHRGRIIYLEYSGSGEVTDTYMFVGKGVTYDTGGADVKAGGHMAGMHRDKCGAATVAGLFGILDKLQPPGIKVVGRLAMVRNSVGAHAYVADEIITSAAGVRVRVGNTDAEGRMAMTDPLCHTKEQALRETNPHLFTVATLTGHAVVALGEPYTGVMDNGPARKLKFAQHLQDVGHVLSEPFEVSTIRREDYEFCAARNEYEDVLQCNNEPSSQTQRGHQFPAAFMIRASGMDKHGIDGDKPLKYTHIDIAGSSGPYPGIPSAIPLISLARMMKAL